jgi:transcription factor E
MKINYLKKVVFGVAGEQAIKIVDLLFNKKDINEFLIAKKLGLTINQTRNLLYKLSHMGILSSIRKKDKRKGWYIYFWTFDVLKSLEVLESSISNEMNGLKNQLENKKTKRFYKCKTCGREVNEETALLGNFTCPECGEVYGLSDNAESIIEVTKQIEKLDKELKLVKTEIKIEHDFLNKKLGRKLKVEETKKKKIKELARQQRAKDKKKLNKALGIKPKKSKASKKSKPKKLKNSNKSKKKQ